MATNRWLSRQKKTPKVYTIQITAYDVTTSYRIHVPSTAGPFAFTLGTGGTVNTTATALAAAWNAREEGEFSGITASAATDTVTLTADNEGDDFTVVSAVSGGAGTIGAVVIATANTSPNDLNDSVNWSNAAVPGADNVYFDDVDGDVKWNLGALSAVTATSLDIYGTYNGSIGLPKANENGFTEYMTDYLTIGITTLNINIVGGTGGSRIKIDGVAVASTVNVYSTGSSADADLPAFIWKGTNASNIMRIEDGSVGVAIFGGETASLAGGLTMTGGSLVAGVGVTFATITQSGGAMDTSSAITTKTQSGGTHLHRAGAITTLTLDGGVFDLRVKTAMTIGTTIIGPGALVDLTNCQAIITFTTLTIRPGGSLIDPNNRANGGGTLTYTAQGGPGSANVVRGPASAVVTIA